ncbi:CoA pyrophosphatase [Edwardsiella piscicida]|uniref:CoA pyrophosphatase n=1 Tax=Edwardsiella piscicida TaxID=1263550 RepID=UPI00290DC4B9|nr:CoA pyrophosphatase [Edwardsiella piscicida]ELM3722052.1 CoA pyrophosphatase [Edwardsiella piscicida]ELM3727934.1 CoA pyrophosphatase [Edwardsiella piscicida]ELV7534818.1 CoA pyrophosphatase [Edwardsiella piscicida]
MRLSPALARFVAHFQLNRPLPERPPRHTRQAAVLIPIVNRPQPTLLLTRRAADLRKHPGQVAFPGGEHDQQDASLYATALREAQEEIGLDPTRVKILGHLPPQDSSSGFCVTPVVAILSTPLRLHPNRDEVAQIFELPLTQALEPGRYHPLDVTRAGAAHRLYLSRYREFLIWGLTAAMIRRLALQTRAP